MLEKKILVPGGEVSFGGGEPTILPEFDKLIDLFLKNGFWNIRVPSSGIKYSKIIEKFAVDLNSGIISDTKNLSYTEYDLLNGAKLFYLLNINWWNNQPASYNLSIAGKKYAKTLCGNEPLLLYVKDDFAVYTDDLYTDIIGLKDRELTLNGFGAVKVFIISNTGEKEINCQLNGITKIKI